MYLIASTFVVSLLGSLHCAGMCGPLVVFAVGDPDCLAWTARARLNIAYHAARAVAYAALGAACGALGALVDLGALQWGISRAAALAAGSLMVAVGVAAVLRYRGVRLPRLALTGRVAGGIVGGVVAAQRAVLGLRPTARAACMGLLTALLPCGWLYLFAAAAAGTGSPLSGMGVMAAFWLGSVPILAALGLGAQAIAAALGLRLPLITALAMIALGATTLAFRMQIPIGAMAAHAETASDVQRQIESAGETLPPCCQTPDAR